MAKITEERAQKLYTLGKQMREAQQIYFRARTTINLRTAKDYERRFDAAIKECEEQLQQLRLL